MYWRFLVVELHSLYDMPVGIINGIGCHNLFLSLLQGPAGPAGIAGPAGPRGSSVRVYSITDS